MRSGLPFGDITSSGSLSQGRSQLVETGAWFWRAGEAQLSMTCWSKWWRAYGGGDCSGSSPMFGELAKGKEGVVAGEWAVVGMRLELDYILGVGSAGEVWSDACLLSCCL